MTHRGSGDPHQAASTFAAAPWLIHLGAAVLLVLVTVLTFLPGLEGAFLEWDDRENFLHNPHFRGLGPAQLRWMLTTGLLGHWMPLTWLSLAVDWTIWGLDPFGYHLTSLGLHAVCAVLVYALARRLFALTARGLPHACMSGAVVENNDVAGEEGAMRAAQVEQHAVAAGDGDDPQLGDLRRGGCGHVVARCGSGR